MSDGSVPLRVTICWSDPPGPLPPPQRGPSNLVLVNDLPLRLSGPGGTTNFHRVVDPFDTDTDLEGQDHGAEPIAGTDPTDASSVFTVAEMIVAGDAVRQNRRNALLLV